MDSPQVGPQAHFWWPANHSLLVATSSTPGPESRRGSRVLRPSPVDGPEAMFHVRDDVTASCLCFPPEEVQSPAQHSSRPWCSLFFLNFAAN